MSKGLVALIAVAAMFVGGVIGFVIGIATSTAVQELLAATGDTEQAPDIKNPITVDAAGFTFKHPGNWTYDLSNADHDPEHSFYIDTPGGSHIEVLYEPNGADHEADYDVAAENLDFSTYRFEDYLKDQSTSEIDRYGQLQGAGRVIRGRYLGSKITVRIFSVVKGTKTLIIVEHVYEMDRKLVQPGFDLIEQSFALK